MADPVIDVSWEELESLYRLLSCPRCGAAVAPAGEELRCGDCRERYPLLWGKVPSFVGSRATLSAAERVELEHLERQLDEYYSPDWRVGYNPPRVALIDAALPGGLVLDVGGADGQIAAHLSAKGRRVVAMEKSARWIEKHGRLLVPFVVGDAYRVPFAAGTFDGVVLGEVLEHLYDPAGALAEARRVLVPGGVVTGTVPNFSFLTKRARYLAGKFGEGDDPLCHGHIRFFTRGVLRELLEQGGFGEIRIEGILRRDLGNLPGKALLEGVQRSAAKLLPELLSVTFFFRATKL